MKRQCLMHHWQKDGRWIKNAASGGLNLLRINNEDFDNGTV